MYTTGSIEVLPVEKQLEIKNVKQFHLFAMGFIQVNGTHLFPHTDGNSGILTDFSSKQCTSIL
jgi:hypothetical protein